MDIKKKDLNEIIGGNGDLIGNNAIPQFGSDLESQAGGTSDKNAKIGTQPFRYDMLGRFGFTLMPFMEGKENEEQTNLISDLEELMYERYVEILKFYYKNPNKLKVDYRKISSGTDPRKEINTVYAKKIMKIIEKHFHEQFKNLDEQFHENLVEGKVIDEKLVDKKNNKLVDKSDDGEIRGKKIEKIAGLINKLEKKDIDKLINLLERK